MPNRHRQIDRAPPHPARTRPVPVRSVQTTGENIPLDANEFWRRLGL